MLEVIITAVIAMFFTVGLYTTAREIWTLIFKSCEETEDSEEPP